MKDFMSLAKARRSVRSYLSEKVSDENIKTIIEAGVWAPTGRGLQPLRFFVLENQEKRFFASQKISELRRIAMPELSIRTGEDPIFYGAPTVVFICAEKGISRFSRDDAMFAAANCFLQARDMGLATVAIGPADLLNDDVEAMAKIGIPENWEIQIAFCLGKTEEFPDDHGRNDPEIIFEK